MLMAVATAEKSSVDFGVQRLHATLHDLRRAGVLAHVGDGKARLAQEARRAAGREELEAVALHERAGEIGEACFVADREERELLHPRDFPDAHAARQEERRRAARKARN